MSSVPGGSYTPPPPPPAGKTSGSSDRTLMVVLAYIWILGLIPLLVKKDDEGADARRRPVTTQPESVLSGRTVEQVAAEVNS